MTALTSLARALAAERGRAVPIRTVRHVHLSARPLVFVPLQLAGEANAPLAAMIGDDPDAPRLLVVYEPRDRGQRFEWAADVADILLKYIEGYAGPEPDDGQPYPDAPQLILPNPGAVRFAGLLGRSTRFRKTDGDYAVREQVPAAGRWLTFYSERTIRPTSALTLSLTEVLGDHWATGQSAAEDASLAAQMAWIDPPAPMTGAEAALEAEDPVRWPPAGPVTDPGFDNLILKDRIDAIGAAAGDDELYRARTAMARALETQLAPTWKLMWRAIGLLRDLPPGAHVARRWERDRWSFTGYVRHLREDGAPQPRRDGPVSAARRLASLESELERLTAQRAYDDPLVMAEHRLSGEAFAGTVTASEPDRVDDSGKRKALRPVVTVTTRDEVIVDTGAVLVSPARPKQSGRVVDVFPVGDGLTEITLELKGGMGRGLTAPPGSVPETGDAITYTTLRDEFRRPPEFPASEETPWTHGGPPEEAARPSDDATAREDWS
ncbi:MAG: hypothetical protein FWE35_23790 [Streptosporangiales bacterium]|nr:hypothetical protein [Streptosporangiales bacterium]